MNITIRRAVAEDIPMLAHINIASWHSTYRGLVADETLDSMKSEEYLKKWEHIIAMQEKGDRSAFVAEDENGTVIGYANCGKSRHGKFPFEGELYAIYLLKEAQGKGVGKKLFYRAVEDMKERGIASFLLFVLSSNTASRKFYESFLPDFTAQETITIDNGQYCDFCYGWSDISKVVSL